MNELLTVRDACRKRMPLDGADAQALEHALSQADAELTRLRAIVARVEDVEGMGQVVLRCLNNGVLDTEWLTNNKLPWEQDIARAVRDYVMVAK